jgi:hypothetical protein
LINLVLLFRYLLLRLRIILLVSQRIQFLLL